MKPPRLQQGDLVSILYTYPDGREGRKFGEVLVSAFDSHEVVVVFKGTLDGHMGQLATKWDSTPGKYRSVFTACEVALVRRGRVLHSVI